MPCRAIKTSAGVRAGPECAEPCRCEAATSLQYDLGGAEATPTDSLTKKMPHSKPEQSNQITDVTCKMRARAAWNFSLLKSTKRGNIGVTCN
jgi:hypothetical protein